MRTQILLVDGVGRPMIHEIPDALIPQNVVPWTHPQRAAKERAVIVHFDRMKDERDADQRPIYRQRGTGYPAIREVYLKLSPIPRLRLEGPCNGD